VLVDGVLRGSGLSLSLAVPPGDHEIGLESDGAPSFRTAHTFAAGGRALLTVDAHGTSGGLTAGRVVTGIFASLSLASAVALSVAAWSAHDAYRREPSQAGFDEVNALNLAADVTWGISCGLGIAAFTFVIADDAGVSGEIEDQE
jgi:hypothetical protein